MCQKRMYCCPTCGEDATSVTQTFSLPYCIIRKRECRLCGYAHETVEFPVALDDSLREAMLLLAENAALRARAEAVAAKGVLTNG